MPRGNPQNLDPVRTKEEATERGRKGGIASGKARRDKTKLKDCLELLLKQKIEIDGKSQTGSEALCAALFQRALTGDDKAWELLRDTSGQKPVDKIEQTTTNIEIDLSDLSDED